MEGVDEMVGGFVVLEWYSLFGTSVLLESQTRKRTRGGGSNKISGRLADEFQHSKRIVS